MAFSHDIIFCSGVGIECPKKEDCYRYKEPERISSGEVYLTATLYKYACREENNFQLYIKDKGEVNED